MADAADSSARRTLLLTGASRGIGRATMKRFLSAGWRVIACSRHATPDGGPLETGPEDHIQLDLADPAETLEAIDEVRRRLADGRLDALVNNAGVSPKGPHGERLGCFNTDLDTWRHVLQVNFMAPMMLARGLFDELRAARGAVVNITSIAGARAHPLAGVAYAASKAALAALTREMAAEFGPEGVRVNAIAPGEVENDALSPAAERLAASLPLRRLGRPEEVAEAIYFLCADQSSYVTGVEIPVNGGEHV